MQANTQHNKLEDWSIHRFSMPSTHLVVTSGVLQKACQAGCQGSRGRKEDLGGSTHTHLPDHHLAGIPLPQPVHLCSAFSSHSTLADCLREQTPPAEGKLCPVACVASGGFLDDQVQIMGQGHGCLLGQVECLPRLSTLLLARRRMIAWMFQPAAYVCGSYTLMLILDMRDGPQANPNLIEGCFRFHICMAMHNIYDLQSMISFTLWLELLGLYCCTTLGCAWKVLPERGYGHRAYYKSDTDLPIFDTGSGKACSKTCCAQVLAAYAYIYTPAPVPRLAWLRGAQVHLAWSWATVFTHNLLFTRYSYSFHFTVSVSVNRRSYQISTSA